MNLRQFVLSLIALICVALSFFILLSSIELPLLWLAKYGFPGAQPVEIVAGFSGASARPSPLGYLFLATIIASSALLMVLLYSTASKAIGSFSFLSGYYQKFYKAFIACLLGAAWLAPTLWIFLSFNIMVAVGIVGGVASAAFAAITVLLKDVLGLVGPEDAAGRVEASGGDR
jgi:hypothetical protein